MDKRPAPSPSASRTIRRMVRKSPVLYGLVAVGMLMIANGLLCAWFGRGDPTSAAIEGRSSPGVLRIGWLCKDTTDCERAYLWEGYISQNLGAEIARQSAELARLDPQSPSARWLCLNSPGGHLAAASFMAYGIRDGQMSTCVVPIQDQGPTDETSPARPSRCDSACPTLWMGGKRHIIAGVQTRLGLHESFIVDSFWCRVGNCGASVIQQGMLIGNAAVFGEWGPRMRMLWAGLGMGPSQVYALSGVEAVSWDLQSFDEAKGNWVWRPAAPGAGRSLPQDESVSHLAP